MSSVYSKPCESEVTSEAKDQNISPEPEKCYITPTKVWLKDLCTKFFPISIDLVRINSDLPGPHNQKVCTAESGYPNLDVI